MDLKIIKLLNNGELPTLAIAKIVIGPDATCKMINPSLYQLEKQGILYKKSGENGKNPIWGLK